MTKKIHFKFSAPLNEGDTEFQTYGCRATNPDICANNCLNNVCAFVREDNICKQPSKSWKKKYEELKEQK